MTTPDGFSYKFSPNPQGLHVYKIKNRRGDGVFGTRCVDNVTIFGGSCHALVEDEDAPNPKF